MFRFEFFLLFALFIANPQACSQGDCFENCLENFENSKLPWPKKNQIVAELAE
jgi:hypothetical protein